MKTLNQKILVAMLACSFALPAGLAMADPRHCPPGHARKGWCGDSDRGHRDSRRERRRDERRENRAYEEGYQAGRDDAYAEGDYIRDDYRRVDDWDDRGWDEPDNGYGYVRVDDRFYKVILGTGLIIEALGQ